MGSRRDVQKTYAFLPPLPEAANRPGFREKYPSLGQIWFADAVEIEKRKLPPARQRLLERAAQQASEVIQDQGPTPSSPSSPAETGLGAADQGLLQLLDDWLQNGREDLCQEFEQHLRESYTWPASERRKMVEVHRQKWKALEDALCQLMEAVRKPSVGDTTARERKVDAAMKRLRPARHAELKIQVKTLREVKKHFWFDTFEIKKPKIGIPSDAEVDAWQDVPGPSKPAIALPDPEERRVEMETQTPVDIEADAVPLSLSQRPLPQGLPSSPTSPISPGACVLSEPDLAEREGTPAGTPGLDAGPGFSDVFAGMDAQERAAVAALVQEQDQLAEQKAESERALKRQDLKMKEQDKAFQEALQAERQHFVEERDRLRNKLRGEELVIETRKLKDELIRLRRVRPMRRDAQQVLWWTEEDMNHVIAGKQLLMRRAAGADSKAEGMCAFAIGTARDWLFRCREMMESQSFAPTGTSMANATALTEQGETKLKAHFAKAVETVGRFKSHAKTLVDTMLPEDRSHQAERLQPRPEKVEKGLEIEREMAKGAREAVTTRLRDAEAKLDRLAEDDLAADFLTRWTEQISAVSLTGMQTQRRTKELSGRIETALRKEAAKYRTVAQAAYADIAADRAAEAAIKRADEAQQRQEAREAARQKDLDQAARREKDKKTKEGEKMVPVKLRMSGLKSTAIDDKAKFGQFAEQKLAKALDLKESQVRVTGIR